MLKYYQKPLKLDILLVRITYLLKNYTMKTYN